MEAAAGVCSFVFGEGEGTLIPRGQVGPELWKQSARSGQAVQAAHAAGQPGSAATWVPAKLRLLLTGELGWSFCTAEPVYPDPICGEICGLHGL